jgi:hypothetical protein
MPNGSNTPTINVPHQEIRYIKIRLEKFILGGLDDERQPSD